MFASMHAIIKRVTRIRAHDTMKSYRLALLFEVLLDISKVGDKIECDSFDSGHTYVCILTVYGRSYGIPISYPMPKSGWSAILPHMHFHNYMLIIRIHRQRKRLPKIHLLSRFFLFLSNVSNAYTIIASKSLWPHGHIFSIFR